MVVAQGCERVANDARGDLSRVRRNNLAYRLTGDPIYLDEARNYRRELIRAPLASACSSAQPFTTLIAELPGLLDEYLEAEAQAMKLHAGETRAEVEAEVREKFEAASAVLAELDHLSAERAGVASDEAIEVQMVLQSVGTVVGIGSIVLVASLLIVLQRDLVVPIFRLTQGIRQMRQSGQVGAKLGLGLRAELGEIETAVDELSHMVAEQRAAQYRFIAAVAHDLKNPLQAIRAYASLVRNDKPLPNESVLRKGFAIIDKQTLRVTHQLEDLLDAARIQAGVLQIEKTDVDLSALVQEVSAALEVLSDKHRIEVDVPETVHVNGDATRLAQVLTNLLSNAVKYSPEGGDIRVALRCAGDEVRISITDQGVGIDKEQIKSLFEPFHRLESTKNIPGIGLGLATSRWIVEAHGGHIEVESEPGRGATFTICLAVASCEHASRGSTPPSSDGPHSHSTSDPPLL